MATAQTGSGKTGAMLIPIINYLMGSNLGNKPRGMAQEVDAIMIAPTRELAQQIYDDAMRLCGNNTGIRPALAYGQARFAFQ